MAFCLLSCKEEKPTNYTITKNNVGEFALYDPVEKFIGMENVVEMKLNDFSTIGYVENMDTLYYVGELNSRNQILEVIVTSNKMKLPNGIHIDMPIRAIVPIYPKIRGAMRTLKIPNLGIDFFEGNYWPKEFSQRGNDLNIQGIDFDFIKVETNIGQDTILESIRLKSNLYS